MNDKHSLFAWDCHFSIFRRIAVALVVMLGCGGLAFCDEIHDARATNVVRSDFLTLPGNYDDGSMEFSSDGAHYAYATGLKGGRTIVDDGVAIQPTGNIGSPIFSPSGKLFFWIISDGVANLYADGTVVPTAFGGNNEIVFSKDGSHWAALGGERLVRGGADVSKLMAMLYVDGKLVGRYSDFSLPDFSPDGKHTAFLALESNERMSLMVDGQTIKTFEKPKAESSFIFNTTIPGPNLTKQAAVHYLSDGKLLVLARDAAGWTVYKDDKALASYPGEVWGGGGYAIHWLNFKGSEGVAWMQFGSLALAKQAPASAWWEQRAGQSNAWRVVVDGRPVDSIVRLNILGLGPARSKRRWQTGSLRRRFCAPKQPEARGLFGG